MNLVYLGGSGESVLVLSVWLSVSAEGVSRLLGFFIFDSDSSLMKGSEVRVMSKDHMSSEMGK